MILTSIIPSNILAALRTYIRNYVASLNAPKAYLNFYDFSSNSITNFPVLEQWQPVIMDAIQGYSYDGLSVSSEGIVTNNGGTKIIFIQGITSISGPNNKEIEFSFFKDGVLVPDSVQSVITDGGGQHAALPLQCVVELTNGQTLQLYVKEYASTTSISLLNVNIIVREI